jgi:hypothetical protein
MMDEIIFILLDDQVKTALTLRVESTLLAQFAEKYHRTKNDAIAFYCDEKPRKRSASSSRLTIQEQLVMKEKKDFKAEKQK